MVSTILTNVHGLSFSLAPDYLYARKTSSDLPSVIRSQNKGGSLKEKASSLQAQRVKTSGLSSGSRLHKRALPDTEEEPIWMQWDHSRRQQAFREAARTMASVGNDIHRALDHTAEIIRNAAGGSVSLLQDIRTLLLDHYKRVVHRSNSFEWNRPRLEAAVNQAELLLDFYGLETALALSKTSLSATEQAITREQHPKTRLQMEEGAVLDIDALHILNELKQAKSLSQLESVRWADRYRWEKAVDLLNVLNTQESKNKHPDQESRDKAIQEILDQYSSGEESLTIYPGHTDIIYVFSPEEVADAKQLFLDMKATQSDTPTIKTSHHGFDLVQRPSSLGDTDREVAVGVTGAALGTVFLSSLAALYQRRSTRNKTAQVNRTQENIREVIGMLNEEWKTNYEFRQKGLDGLEPSLRDRLYAVLSSPTEGHGQHYFASPLSQEQLSELPSHGIIQSSMERLSDDWSGAEYVHFPANVRAEANSRMVINFRNQQKTKEFLEQFSKYLEGASSEVRASVASYKGLLSSQGITIEHANAIAKTDSVVIYFKEWEEGNPIRTALEEFLTTSFPNVADYAYELPPFTTLSTTGWPGYGFAEETGISRTTLILNRLISEFKNTRPDVVAEEESGIVEEVFSTVYPLLEAAFLAA